MKTAWADVPKELIEAKGAVSAEVAIALAEGIRRRVGSTLGVGITGIAGPGGGSEEKPVGLVHLALASASGVKERVARFPRSEEHTSELQSRSDLVCRLLLEKKKLRLNCRSA